mmetsp:Transcript_14351/g.38073  ORF Transcript_14351/g.38073 Transcript_14351/m.38073 type:complete len:82 (+) Transcript_14351:1446-1691(+)
MAFLPRRGACATARSLDALFMAIEASQLAGERGHRHQRRASPHPGQRDAAVPSLPKAVVPSLPNAVVALPKVVLTLLNTAV